MKTKTRRGSANELSVGGKAAFLLFSAKLLHFFVRHNLRGQTRLRLMLQRHAGLRLVPVRVGNLPAIYMDLGLASTLWWLKKTPCATIPVEADEQRIMRQVVRNSCVVFDVGANLGLHTVLLSQLVGPEGKVFAFEPNEEVLSSLSATVENLGNTVLLTFALSNDSRPAALFIPEGDHSCTSLSNWTEGSYGETHQIICEQRRIDDLVEAGTLPRPDFIKCDVEGAELIVFEGGHNTLNRVDAPIILFETNVHTSRGFGLRPEEAKRFLESLPAPRYKFFEVKEGGALAPFQACTKGHSNILAVPESRTPLCPLPLGADDSPAA